MKRLAQLDDERLSELLAVAGADVIIVLGAAEKLPWVDGVVYLGHDPDAPELLLPTTVQVSVPTPLLLRAMGRSNLAMLGRDDGGIQVVAVGGARPLDRASLALWLESA